MRDTRGFTLIELLIVIGMIGALAGIGLSVINPSATQGRARDGVRLSNVKSISEAIQSYRQLEGRFPDNGDQEDPNSLLRQTYLTKWPTDADEFTYNYYTDGVGFLVYVGNSLGGCYKFQSDWARQLSCPASECSAQFTNQSNCD